MFKELTRFLSCYIVEIDIITFTAELLLTICQLCSTDTVMESFKARKGSWQELRKRRGKRQEGDKTLCIYLDSEGRSQLLLRILQALLFPP
jgi:GTP cyclohydrolase II